MSCVTNSSSFSVYFTANHKIFGKKRSWNFQTFGTPYDYKSIMHYGRYHFSKNRKQTIVSRDPKVKWFGNLTPSELDIKQVCFSLY